MYIYIYLYVDVYVYAYAYVYYVYVYVFMYVYIYTVYINAEMPDCPASGHWSVPKWKKLMISEPVWYQTKPTQSGIFLGRAPD
jgi:hypothetical protein